MDALKAKNASIREREVALKEGEKELREKLEGVGQLLIDGNNKLKSSVQVRIETATGLSQRLNTELSELREKQKGVEYQNRKLIEKKRRRSSSPTKKLRLNATLPKQAAKQNKKSNIRNTATTT